MCMSFFGNNEPSILVLKTFDTKISFAMNGGKKKKEKKFVLHIENL